jgi:hypothetical protein
VPVVDLTALLAATADTAMETIYELLDNRQAPRKKSRRKEKKGDDADVR